MNEETGVEYLTPWQVNNVIEGLGGLGVVERLPLPSKSNLSNSFKTPTYLLRYVQSTKSINLKVCQFATSICISFLIKVNQEKREMLTKIFFVSFSFEERKSVICRFAKIVR